MSQQKSAGYIAANRDQGRLIVMFENDNGQKRYGWVDLEAATEVITGKRANVAIWRREY